MQIAQARRPIPAGISYLSSWWPPWPPRDATSSPPNCGTETAEWRKTYELQPGGEVEIINVNGKIEVEPSSGNAVEVVAKKTAKGATPEAAKENLNRVEIVDASTPPTSVSKPKSSVPAGG